LLGSEASDPIKIEGGNREAKQHGHLDLTKHTEEPASEIDEGTLQG
jgi:hypothetical protein